MFLRFRSSASSQNPWRAQDRQEHRRIVVTGLVFASAVSFGFGLLIYALVAS